ncbi:putative aldehyde oxidase Art an 7 [Impatiens glandulifera]|uniref:putative aldehyde oxidase Art an 7 n=1 Tax=Impatiens glandulifera TaxID=253017 RepID=UPI001FB06F93|nr:putative aldehyde oxidase Art an 7 [Impatiens glandulifera]
MVSTSRATIYSLVYLLLFIYAPLGILGKQPDFETSFIGSWVIDNPDSGVSAMQMQLLPYNKIIIFDLTNSGQSNISLPGNETNCRPMPKGSLNEEIKYDCWAHAVEYDVDNAAVRPLKILTDCWCSSGGMASDGTLISTGGFKDGARAIRTMSPCEDCDWLENQMGLGSPRCRRYATQEKLEDGSFILVGGRDQFTYEFFKGTLENEIRQVEFPFLLQTKDEFEDNLYPFTYLLPDANLFIFANDRGIILNPKTGRVVRTLPNLTGSRSYPGTGMSALLPLKFSSPEAKSPDSVEVLICGGNKKEAFPMAQIKKPRPIFLPAFQDCGRIRLSDSDPKWEIEMMPSRRVMGDMLILPNAELLLLNGASNGSSGWRMAEVPNLTPVVYSPNKSPGQRFKEMAKTTIPRMYHSSSAVLPDGKVLVAGSNTNPNYDFRPKTRYKTELRAEKFSPPYLDPALEVNRPQISQDLSQRNLTYGHQFLVVVTVLDNVNVNVEDLMVTLYAPPFTTHGYSHNQRMIVLTPVKLTGKILKMIAPPGPTIAPPGYYLLHVVHRGVPSKAMWVQLTNDNEYKPCGYFKVQLRSRIGGMIPNPVGVVNPPIPDDIGSPYPINSLVPFGLIF